MLFATPLVTKWFCHFLDSGRNISLPVGHAHPCQPILRCLSCLAVWTDKFTTWLATLLSLSFSLAGSLLQFTVIPVQWLFFSRLAPVSRHSAFYAGMRFFCALTAIFISCYTHAKFRVFPINTCAFTHAHFRRAQT